jgi:hypothetical protein
MNINHKSEWTHAIGIDNSKDNGVCMSVLNKYTPEVQAVGQCVCTKLICVSVLKCHIF